MVLALDSGHDRFMKPISIRALAPDELAQASELLQELNPDVPVTVLAERLHTLLRDHSHYELIGAFSETQLLAVAGAWVATKLWCGRYLEIDNLVVASSQRASGIGTQLIQHLEGIGRDRDCKVMVLDSYTSNQASHRLYHRLGYEIWGFHFIKPIGDWKAG
jgi:ribosomal protein S18 acetylase RimI-like enzyme